MSYLRALCLCTCMYEACMCSALCLQLYGSPPPVRTKATLSSFLLACFGYEGCVVASSEQVTRAMYDIIDLGTVASSNGRHDVYVRQQRCCYVFGQISASFASCC